MSHYGRFNNNDHRGHGNMNNEQSSRQNFSSNFNNNQNAFQNRGHQQHHHQQQNMNNNNNQQSGNYRNTNAKIRTLWIGNLEPYMDEQYVRRMFYAENDIINIKIMRNRATGQTSGFGFIEFTSRDVAEKVLNKYDGKPLMNEPNKTYKLNWATMGIGGDRRQEAVTYHNVFVGDLAPDVNDQILLSTFKSKYPSVVSGKVVMDPTTGYSKGYGFVKFTNEEEQKRSMDEMDGAYISNRPIKIAPATFRNKRQDDDNNNNNNNNMGNRTQDNRHHNQGGNFQDNRQHHQNNFQQRGGFKQRGFQQNHHHQNQNQQIDAANDPDNTTLYVGQIDETVDEDMLKNKFQIFGQIVMIKIPQAHKCAFIQFLNRQDAERAMEDMNGTVIGLNRVRVSWGRNQNKSTQSKASLEQQKIEEMKEKEKKWAQYWTAYEYEAWNSFNRAQEMKKYTELLKNKEPQDVFTKILNVAEMNEKFIELEDDMIMDVDSIEVADEIEMEIF